jgi:plastocyanin
MQTRKSILAIGILLLAIIATLALAGCSSSASSTTSNAPTSSQPTTTSSTTPGGPVTINLTAQNIAFDTNTITVAAGANVTINFNNKDSGVPHNFSLYTDSSASTTLYKGQVINGPGTIAYTFTAPTKAGTYFFRCDIHPTTMTGSFIVQ